MQSQCVILAVLAAAPLASAQGLVPNAAIPPLKRVEPGVGDVGPLSTSNRVLPLDLRVPTGFQNVYSFQQKDASGRLQTYYVRQSGALSAIFPRSQYTETPGGLFAEVPPGTMWVIGPLHIQEPAKPKVERAYNFLDLSVDDSLPAQTWPPPATPRESSSIALPTIWSSEAYRQRRVGRLLDSIAPK